ncbi:hypothetical protein [Bradyrhizobium sp. Leo121]|uniref:hypothetical protein n=1 Tax=Bradyrhizobium sp. Leo121 TaxID=1571195 RepID=UPI0032E4ABD6
MPDELRLGIILEHDLDQGGIGRRRDPQIDQARGHAEYGCKNDHDVLTSQECKGGIDEFADSAALGHIVVGGCAKPIGLPHIALEHSVFASATW